MKAALLSALLLAACSNGLDQSEYNGAAQPSAKDVRAEQAIARGVARNGAAATAAGGAPVTVATPGLDRSRVLPAAFQGYWALTPLDCELANVDATGRLFIEGDGLRFYESRARIAAVESAAPTRVVARLDYSGEGERWTRRTTLALTAGGTRLTRTADGERAITYQRC